MRGHLHARNPRLGQQLRWMPHLLWQLTGAMLLVLLGFGGMAKAQGGGLEPAVLPADLVSTTFDFPTELVLAVEDAQFELATRLLEAEIMRHPEALALRYLRQKVFLEMDSRAFVNSARSPLTSRGSLADRADQYEALHHEVLRFQAERTLYRGDRDEGAAAFIARLTAQANRLLAALGRLEQQPSTSPWITFSRCLLLRDLFRLTPKDGLALWEATPDAGAWQEYLRIKIYQLELAPAAALDPWMTERLPRMSLEADPLAPMVLLASLARRIRYVDRFQSIAIYGAEKDRFPQGPFRDDFDLAYGAELAYSYVQGDRLAAVDRLRALIAPPFNNSSYQAMAHLGSLLRRLERYSESIALYDRFHEQFPSPWYRFDRPIGRAHYHLEEYKKALAAFREAANGPRGNGSDFLFIAEAMRFLTDDPEIDVSPAAVRQQALKLTDFASAAMKEEIWVWGWTTGKPGQLIEAYGWLSELKVLSRHALLFPLTFVSVGLAGFFELLLTGLALIVFVSYPRLSKRIWRLALTCAVASLGLAIPALLFPADNDMGWAGNLSWLAQAGLRLFLLLSGALILSSVVGMRGLELPRPLFRLKKRMQRRPLLLAIWPTALAAALLGGVALLLYQQGWAPIPYLARFPTLLTAGELGISPQDGSPWVHAGLTVFYVVKSEVMARGFLLTVLAFLFRRVRGGMGWAVFLSALVWALLTAGLMSPSLWQVVAGMVGGMVLGWVRVRRGLDSAIIAHVLAALLTGGLS